MPRYTILEWRGNLAARTHGEIEADNPRDALMLSDSVPLAAKSWPYSEDEGCGGLDNEEEQLSWESRLID